jgi:hypothetical protein
MLRRVPFLATFSRKHEKSADGTTDVDASSTSHEKTADRITDVDASSTSREKTLHPSTPTSPSANPPLEKTPDEKEHDGDNDKHESESESEDESKYLSGFKLIWLTTGLLMATFVIALDNTVSIPLVPPTSPPLILTPFTDHRHRHPPHHHRLRQSK